MAIKKVILSKKIAGTLYNVYPKTSADVVTYEDTTTVADKLAELTTGLEGVISSDDVDDKISAATTELYNKIMGLTDETTTIDEAYDTLKEVADYLAAHGDVVTGFTSSISDLTDRVDTIESTITTINNTLTSLQDAIDALDYSKVTASTTNGNIVVDGTEVTVYTLPSTLPASMIETDDDHQFVTADEKETIANAASIVATTTEPTDADAEDNTLYLVYEA